MFVRPGMRLAAIPLFLALVASLPTPAPARAAEPYWLSGSPAFGSSVAVGGSTTLTLHFQGYLPAGDVVTITDSLTPSSGFVYGSVDPAQSTCDTVSVPTPDELDIAQLVGADGQLDCLAVLSVTGTGPAGRWLLSLRPTDTAGQVGVVFVMAYLYVYAAPSTSIHFAQSPVDMGRTDSLHFMITSPFGNPGDLTGVGFTATLPAGLSVVSSSSSVCGGTLTITAPSTISLADAIVGGCLFQVSVSAGTVGHYEVSSGPVTSANGGTGAAGTTTLDVVRILPPTMTAAFGASSLPLGGKTSLTFTVTNPNGAPTVVPAALGPNDLSGIGFTNTLPSGLVVATPNGLTGSCGGGTIGAAAGSGTISLSGATLAAGESCTFSVQVLAVSQGTQRNSTGDVSSNEGGAGAAGLASITVGPAVTPPPTTTADSGAPAGPSGLPLLLVCLFAFACALVTMRRMRA